MNNRKLNNQEYPAANREYKDRLFRFVFQKMLNINYGHNQALMEKCRRLKEYAYFVDTVRRNFMVEMPLRAAVMRAIDECIEKGVLEDILIPQKAEVVQMILETFDQEKHDEAMKKEGYEAGISDGRREGQAIERENGIRRLISSLMEAGVPEENISLVLQKQYELSPEETELRELTDHTLEKLRAMSDEEFAELELCPDFDE